MIITLYLMYSTFLSFILPAEQFAFKLDSVASFSRQASDSSKFRLWKKSVKKDKGFQTRMDSVSKSLKFF